MTFTKSDSADWTLEANQDRLTDSVWFTRQHTKSLFNIVKEASYTKNSSPAGTEWGFGTTAKMDTINFDNLEVTCGGSPANILDMDLVLHLIAENIFIDFKFISWAGNNSGGGFSYTRSTKKFSNLTDVFIPTAINIYPNPTKNILNVAGFQNQTTFNIQDIRGATVQTGQIENNGMIDISSLSVGMYFFNMFNEEAIRFIKE